MKDFRDCFLAFLDEPYYSRIESPAASDRYSACDQPPFKPSRRSPASRAFKPTESPAEPTDTHTSPTLEPENPPFRATSYQPESPPSSQATAAPTSTLGNLGLGLFA